MPTTYVNYHAHSEYSNAATTDVTITNLDRVLRAKELGHIVVSGIEHGSSGNFFELYDLAKEHGLKPLLGTEAYFVKDRLKEYPVEDKEGKFKKDNTNAHLILLAKNENGRKAINRIVSEANKTGFYYKPRVDLELVLSLPEDDVWVTTACLGGIWKYEDNAEIVKVLFDKFGENFFLEVQYHHTEQQVELNKLIVSISDSMGIPMIAGLDTHMIYPEEKRKRDIFLASRGIVYEHEEGWFLDFPEGGVARQRFIDQGVLTDTQIDLAIARTRLFEEVEEYTSHIFDKEKIKLPSIYSDKTQKQKDEIFTELIRELWKEERNSVPRDRWDEYVKEIKFELNTIIETGMADYFLLNYEIIKRAKEMGGNLTLTSRGSAAGFFLAKLLGFTTADRLTAKVKLFSERFMSKERILETHSLPDIDFNVGNPPVFVEAQREVLGDGKAYRMITYQRTHESSGWKMYARYKEVDFELANRVSSKLAEWRSALKYAEEGTEHEYRVEDYIGKENLALYESSKEFLGLINSLGSHPCAFLLLDEGNIEEEIGVIRTKGGEICACVDGKTADKRLFLKNDLLKVTVVDLIYRTYERIGRKPHTLDELIEACEGDSSVWGLYKNGVTLGLNQVETFSTTRKVMGYAPTNIAELSSFVAAIRPSFQSLYAKYAKREPFSYGIPSLDKIIQTPEFPYSYMLYQENIMAVLGFAGIPMYETYQVVKDIAKKNHDKIYAYKETFIPLMMKRLLEEDDASKSESKEIADNIWTIIEDAASYGFNASHSYSVAGDSLYGAWQKAHYPLEFYETLLRIYEEDSKKDKIGFAKREAERFFGITFPSFKWGQDNRTVTMDKERNAISLSMKTIKGFGDKFAQTMFDLNESFDGDSFLELLVFAEESGALSKSKWKKMISINYFSEFCGARKAEKIFEEFIGGKLRYNKKHGDKTKQKRLPALISLFSEIPDENFSARELIGNEISVLGQVSTRLKELNPSFVVVEEIDETYSPKIKAYSLANGTSPVVKMNKRNFKNSGIGDGDIIYIEKFEKKPRMKKTDEGFVEIGGFDHWIDTFHHLKEYDLEEFFGLNAGTPEDKVRIVSKLRQLGGKDWT